MQRYWIELVGGPATGRVVKRAPNESIMIEGECYSPHSGIVYGLNPSVYGYLLADSEYPPGEMVALYVR